MTSTPKIRIGISSCLTGEKVRYDGEHQRFPYATDVLAAHFTLVPVCPEVEVGMPVPRETIHLEGDPADPRVVAPGSGTDWTRRIQTWSRRRLKELATEDLCGFILKKNSPSCGLFKVKVYPDQGPVVRKGRGLFAAAFTAANPLVPVEDEDRLMDLRLRENFIERVFGYHRLRAAFAGRWRRSEVAAFHDREKFLLMAHSPRHCKELDRMIAAVADLRPAAFRDRYCTLFMACLGIKTTPSGQAKVLRKIAGQLRGIVADQDQRSIMSAIEEFREGQVPLVVPVTLLRYAIALYEVPSVGNSSYLDLHPSELLLRNHA